VEQLIYVGSETHYILRAGQTELKAQALNVRGCLPEFDIGREATVYFPPTGLVVLED
jgi:hypothetical protein